MNHMAVGVAKNLHLNVTGALDKAFGKQAAIAEVALAFSPSDADGVGQVFFATRNLHPLSATASGTLDQQRKAYGTCALSKGGWVFCLIRRRRDGHALGDGKFAGRDLVAHQLNDRSGWPDKYQARIRNGLRESGILGQETITGMDGVTTCIQCGAHHCMHVQPCGNWRTSEHFDGFVRLSQCRSVLVLLVPGHHSGNTHAPGRAHYAQRDFCSVGDEKFSYVGH